MGISNLLPSFTKSNLDKETAANENGFRVNPELDNLYFGDVYVAEAEKDTRRLFVRKVFSILTIQVGIIIVMSKLLVLHGLRFATGYTTLTILAGLAFAGIIALLLTFHGVVRKFPMNFLALVCLSLSLAFFVGSWSAILGTHTHILRTLIFIFLLLLGLTGYEILFRDDFSGNGGYYGVAMITLVLSSARAIIFYTPLLQFIFTVCNLLLVGAYVVYETKLVVDGAHCKHKFMIDDYAFAAMMMYADFVRHVLEFFRVVGSDAPVERY